MQVECDSCGKFVDPNNTVRRTVRKEKYRVGGAISFGGRSGSGSSNSTHRSGGKVSSGSGNRTTTGGSWRFRGGRTIYEMKEVRICNECLVVEAARRSRKRKIIAIVVVLLLIWWAGAALFGSPSEITTGIQTGPATTGEFPVPVVSGASPTPITASASQNNTPEQSSPLSSPVADHRQLDSLPEKQEVSPDSGKKDGSGVDEHDASKVAKSEERGVINTVKAQPDALTEATADQIYQERLKSECGGELACGESIRRKLCDGRWSDAPPAGQAVCQTTNSIKP